MGYVGDLDKKMSTMEKIYFFSFRGERMPTLLRVPEYQFFYRWIFLSGRYSLFMYVYYGANLERARLALLDAWSEGNAIPHNRLLPIGEFGDLGLRQR